MNIFKVIIGLLLIASLIFSVNLVLILIESGSFPIWTIVMLSFLVAIPIALGFWLLVKKKPDTNLKNRNIVWAWIILILGIIWLIFEKQNLIDREIKMTKIEEGARTRE